MSIRESIAQDPSRKHCIAASLGKARRGALEARAGLDRQRGKGHSRGVYWKERRLINKFIYRLGSILGSSWID